VVVRRIGEPAQAEPALLSQLRAAGLRPGKRLRVVATAGGVAVAPAPDGPQTELSAAVTDHVFVAEAPSAPDDDHQVDPN